MNVVPSRSEFMRHITMLEAGNVNKVKGYISCLVEMRKKESHGGRGRKPLLTNK